MKQDAWAVTAAVAERVLHARSRRTAATINLSAVNKIVIVSYIAMGHVHSVPKISSCEWKRCTAAEDLLQHGPDFMQKSGGSPNRKKARLREHPDNLDVDLEQYEEFNALYWTIRRRVLTNSLLTKVHDHIRKLSKQLESPLLNVIVQFHRRNDTSRKQFEPMFQELTEVVEAAGYHWKDLNDFRMKLLQGARQVVWLSDVDMSHMKVVLTNGSDNRVSDVDVAVSGPYSAEVALILIYALGLLSKDLLKGTVASMQTLTASLAGWQKLLDIEVYSSSGVIRTHPGQTVGPHRGLHEIENGLYQLVRNSRCSGLTLCYRVLAAYLWTRLPNGAAAIEKLGLMRDGPEAFRKLAALKRARELGRSDRLILQLAASYSAAAAARLALTEEGAICSHLARWEYTEALANAMSPESTVAPATFVDVVIGSQRRQRSQTVMAVDELYLVLLENLGFMREHLEATPISASHTRKAFKYGERCCSAYARMRDTALHLSGEDNIGWNTMKNLGLDPPNEPAMLRLPTDKLRVDVLQRIHQNLWHLFENLLTVTRCQSLR
jgi:hypothetical protein